MSQEEAKPQWGLNTIFPTNVLVRDWDVTELNTALRKGIIQDKAKDPEGIYRSNNAGTWHSKDNIMGRLGDAGDALRKMFGEGFITYAHSALGFLKDKYTIDCRMSAWAMVYSDRGYAAVHSHPNCHASGVYYVDNTFGDTEITMATGVRVKPGDIEFLDTRRGGEIQSPAMQFSPSAVYRYRDGRMLIFPSSLPHYVHPCMGEGQRISIACNATFVVKEK